MTIGMRVPRMMGLSSITHADVDGRAFRWSHEEGGDRVYAVATQQFDGDQRGHIRALRAARVETVSKDGRLEFNTIAGSEFEIKADLVLLAMGFLGPERGGLLDQLGVRMTERGAPIVSAAWPSR